jgi:hypothetical protein
MVRIQVQLTERQVKALRRVSSLTGQPIADLIRHGIDQLLGGRREPGPEERIKRAMRAAGQFSSGASDVSSDHDRHLAEAFRG